MKFITKKRRRKIFNYCLASILSITLIVLAKLESDSDYKAAQLRFKRMSAELSNLDFVCTPDAGELKWFHPVTKVHLFSDPFRQPYPTKELRNVCKGSFKNKEIFVFDYKYGRPYRTRRYRSYVHKQTVAAFRFPEKKFSDFYLIPTNFIEERLIWGDGNIDIPQRPNFSKFFRLGAVDKKSTVALFENPKLTDFFEKHREWAVEGVGEWIIIYQPDKRIDPDELQHFINQTSEIAEVMQPESN